MLPGIGIGERGERAGRGEVAEGEVERECCPECCPRSCNNSPSDSLLLLFMEILLLGVDWLFGDDMAGKEASHQVAASPSLSSGHALCD